MAPFDITTIGKNLQTFKGSYKFLEEFLTQVEILHDLTDEQDHNIFIKYVYNFKLTTQVRNTLGRADKPTTFAQLKQSLEKAYPNPRTLQTVLTELGATKQQNSSIAEYREKLTELANELSMFEISNLENPTQQMKDVVYKLNDNVALNTFIRGVNEDYRQILLSNMPKTLNEAVERCMAAEKSFKTENNNVYSINTTQYRPRNSNRYNNRGNYNNNNNYESNNYHNNANFRTNNYNRSNLNRNNYNNFSGNNNINRNNFNNFIGNHNTQNSSNRNNFNRSNNSQNNSNRHNYNNQQNNSFHRNMPQRRNRNQGNS